MSVTDRQPGEARLVDAGLMACPECDLVLRRRPTPADHDLACPRCAALLSRRVPGGHRQTILALVLGAAIVLGSMLTQPLVGLERAGLETQLSLAGMGTQLLGSPQGWAVASLVLGTLVVAPLVFLGLVAIVLIPPLACRLTTAQRRGAVRLAVRVRPWMMLEVFAVSMGVAITKLGDLARVDYGVLLPALIAAVVLVSAVGTLFDADALWDEFADEEAAP